MSRHEIKRKKSEARVCKHNCVGGSANICNARKSGVVGWREKKRANKKEKKRGRAGAINSRGRDDDYFGGIVFRRRGRKSEKRTAVGTFRADCTGVSLPLRLLLFVYYNLDTIISFSSSHASRRR